MTPGYQQVIAVHRAGDAVFHWFLVPFRGKGAEQTIEDDEDAAVVGVDIVRVATMVDPVVAGGVEQILDSRVQSLYQGGVDKELVDQ